MKVLVTQSCLTLCDPMDYSLPGSSVHGILQARILEWVTITFSRGSSWHRDQTRVSYTAGRFFTIRAISKWKNETEILVTQSDSLQFHGLGLTKCLCPWDSLSKNTGVGCHFLLQGIFPNQGSNPGLLHCRQTLYHQSCQGNYSK